MMPSSEHDASSSKPDESANSPSSSVPTKPAMPIPHLASGPVVKGFGRGSKQLGIPTANYPDTIVDELPGEFEGGVYYGWAQVDDGPVYKMVMSIGKNPYYNNEKRTMETYVMHQFDEDFYGANLKTIITGYIRPMSNYNSLGKPKDELISAINKDIADARAALDSTPEQQAFQAHSFFSSKAT